MGRGFGEGRISFTHVAKHIARGNVNQVERRGAQRTPEIITGISPPQVAGAYHISAERFLRGLDGTVHVASGGKVERLQAGA